MPDYQTIADALTARGFTARVGGDHCGQYVTVPLEGDSVITTGHDPERGWYAWHHDLSGEPAPEPIFQVEEVDPQALCDAITAFLGRRNREALAAEMLTMMRHELYYLAPEVNATVRLLSDPTGSAVVISDYHPTDPRLHLVIASYPDPARGVTTSGEAVTGWRVLQQHPDTEDAIVYDDPADADPDHMADAILAWIRQPLPQPYAGTAHCQHPVGALIADETTPEAVRCTACHTHLPPPPGLTLACGHSASAASASAGCRICANTRKQARLEREKDLPEGAIEILQRTLRDLDATTTPGIAWYPDPKPMSRTSRSNGTLYQITLWLMTDQAAREAELLD